MQILIQRKWPRDRYIIGKLFVDGAFFCHTLEPPRSAAHPCIPCGTYPVVMYPSARFKGMRPLVCNVPHRSGILIHEGNYPSDTSGCILVGMNTKVGAVLSSRSTLAQLIDLISKADSVSLTIKESV